MSLLPPSPPRYGEPGEEMPTDVSGWRYLNKFFFQLCRYLVTLANSAQTDVNGSTSGAATFTQVFQGVSFSMVVIYCDALDGTATYKFPSAFKFQPAIVSTDQLGPGIVTSLSLTSVTLTGVASTGFLFLEGF